MDGDDLTAEIDYQVLFELAGWVTKDDLGVDLSESPQHRLRDHQPHVTHGPDGHTKLDLTVAGPDLWTCTLIAMTLIRQTGYEPASIQVAPLTTHLAA